MIGRIGPWHLGKSAESHGTHGRAPETIRILGLLLASLMILGVISGCADNGASTPTANEQLCTDLSNLQASVSALLDVGSNENMSQFSDKWDQVKADLEDVKTSAQEVASANMDSINASFDALVASVQNALSASSISDAVASIKSAADDFVNTIRTSLSDLNCSN